MDPVFRWRHFAPEVILLSVRGYCKYGISYRELEERMTERGTAVGQQRYAPELEKRTLGYQHRLSFSWGVDEAYIKARGKWKSLFHAIDKAGHTFDFYLPATRNAGAAKCVLAKALKCSKHDRPGKANTDKNPAYGEAIRELKKEGLLAADCTTGKKNT